MKEKKTTLELFQPEQDPIFVWQIDKITDVYYTLLVKYEYNDMDVRCLRQRILNVMLFDDLKDQIINHLQQEFKYEYTRASDRLKSILREYAAEWVKDNKIETIPEEI